MHRRGLQILSCRSRISHTVLQRFGAPAQTSQEKLKQMRFLASRGFTGDVVRKVVSGQMPDDMPDQD